jgi:hypothetical protein
LKGFYRFLSKQGEEYFTVSYAPSRTEIMFRPFLWQLSRKLTRVKIQANSYVALGEKQRLQHIFVRRNFTIRFFYLVNETKTIFK